jgi:hypothetical protein
VLQTLYSGIVQGAEGMGHGAWKVSDCADKPTDEFLSSAVPLPITNNQSPIPREAAPLRVVASRSHCNDETAAFIAELEVQYGAVELVSSGSSLKLCMVAEGRADIYPRIAPTMEWDTAAAQAVVEASGGRVVKYNPAVPAGSYLTQSAECRVQSAENSPLHAPCPLPSAASRHAPCAMPHALYPLRYNKSDLLNPHFVVFR